MSDGISLNEDGSPFSPWQCGSCGFGGLCPGLGVCLALPDALAVPGGSCFMSLIAEGQARGAGCFSALRLKGVSRVSCVWLRLAGAGLWDQVTNHL